MKLLSSEETSLRNPYESTTLFIQTVLTLDRALPTSGRRGFGVSTNGTGGIPHDAYFTVSPASWRQPSNASTPVCLIPDVTN